MAKRADQQNRGSEDNQEQQAAQPEPRKGRQEQDQQQEREETPQRAGESEGWPQGDPLEEEVDFEVTENE